MEISKSLSKFTLNIPSQWRKVLLKTTVNFQCVLLTFDSFKDKLVYLNIIWNDIANAVLAQPQNLMFEILTDILPSQRKKISRRNHGNHIASQFWDAKEEKTAFVAGLYLSDRQFSPSVDICRCLSWQFLHSAVNLIT